MTLSRAPLKKLRLTFLSTSKQTKHISKYLKPSRLGSQVPRNIRSDLSVINWHTIEDINHALVPPAHSNLRRQQSSSRVVQLTSVLPILQPFIYIYNISTSTIGLDCCESSNLSRRTTLLTCKATNKTTQWLQTNLPKILRHPAVLLIPS